MATGDTTKLTAVNDVLTSLGMGPVTALGTTRAGTLAEQVLDSESALVQSEGWHFNTEYDVELTPDVSDNIIVPTDALSIDAHKVSEDVTQVGTKLFDLEDNSFTFTSKINVDIVRFRDITDLPQPARAYIVARAARVYQDRFLGSSELGNRLLRDEFDARNRLITYEAEVGDFTAFDHFDGGRALQRGTQGNPITNF